MNVVVIVFVFGGNGVSVMAGGSALVIVILLSV